MVQAINFTYHTDKCPVFMTAKAPTHISKTKEEIRCHGPVLMAPQSVTKLPPQLPPP